ncbi:N-acetylmuramoyl-L-alanine amidase [Rickettsia endosymbiont of Halotydeus destructor]|uniref:N-acetylmuramoyl-L-alanine amidase n=1 Tax=Rickettsia endosymbiont of Halotydeus destructor TaxID=2996754 RepID=UPI003BAE63F2
MITIDKTTYKATIFDNRIKFLILHYTEQNFEKSIESLTGSRVSAHYLVNDQNPNHIFQLVEEQNRAWHAGVSNWKGRNNINDTSIGIEIVNLGFTLDEKNQKIWHPYPLEQINSVINLCQQIIHNYDIKPTDIIAHSDIAPSRKVDPGPLFPWKQLYDNGIGAWYDVGKVKSLMPHIDILDIKTIQEKFIKYGYGLEATGIMDSQTHQVITSFQIHFRPSNFSGILDSETAAILDSLIEKYCEN